MDHLPPPTLHLSLCCVYGVITINRFLCDACILDLRVLFLVSLGMSLKIFIVTPQDMVLVFYKLLIIVSHIRKLPAALLTQIIPHIASCTMEP